MENTSGFDEDNSRVYLRHCVFPLGGPFESATPQSLMFSMLRWQANYS
jgi:hypothetical protein